MQFTTVLCEIARQLNKYAKINPNGSKCLQVKLSENTRKYCLTNFAFRNSWEVSHWVYFSLSQYKRKKTAEMLMLSSIRNQIN